MKILVLGDSILDHYVHGRINRMSPEDNSVPIVDVSHEEYRLGGVMNVAANLKSIGYSVFKDLQVSLFSVFSPFTVNMLQKKGISCDDSCISRELLSALFEPSSCELIKTRIINEENKQLLRIDNRLKYEQYDIKLYKNSLDPNLDLYDAIVLSDYCKGLIDDHIVQKIKDFQGPIFIDTKNPDLSFWDALTSKQVFIKKNENEYSISQNATDHTVVVTKGSRGCSIMEWPVYNCDVIPIENPDVTGAGDVFMAGFVLDYLKNKNVYSAAKFANMCAGLSCKKLGTAEVWLYEI